MNWLRKLQVRWNVGSVMHVVIILIVFALTGTTVARLLGPALTIFFGDQPPVWAGVLYIVLVLPIYNVFLLLFGFVFGQFYFFWNFEKKMFRSIGSLFRKARKR
jgi:hypothetical protein